MSKKLRRMGPHGELFEVEKRKGSVLGVADVVKVRHVKSGQHRGLTHLYGRGHNESVARSLAGRITQSLQRHKK
jgi:hypothetical protein